MRTLILAAALTLAGCDSRPPAQPKTIDEINQIVGIADQAVSVAQKIGAGASTADVQGATQEMYAAIDAAGKQINEMTQRIAAGKYLGRHAIDPMDVSTCTGALTSSVRWLESETMLPHLMTNAVECGINARIYFEDVSSDDGAAVALAIGIIYPIALAASVKAGLEIEPSLQEYRSVNEAIVARLAPKCRERNGASSAGSEQVRYECAAYEVAMSVRPKLETLADRRPITP
jgi:hypothetical protein